MKNTWIKIAVAALAFGAITAPLAAKLTPEQEAEFRAAKDAGLIGELPDGRLDFVTPPTSALDALVSKINIDRKALYFTLAEQQGVQPEVAAISFACNVIKDKVKIGQYYKTPEPNSRWVKRDAGPPILHASCPKGG